MESNEWGRLWLPGAWLGRLDPDRDTWQSWRYGYDLESGEAIPKTFSQNGVTLYSKSYHNVRIESRYARGLKLFRDIWHLGDSRHASIREEKIR